MTWQGGFIVKRPVRVSLTSLESITLAFLNRGSPCHLFWLWHRSRSPLRSQGIVASPAFYTFSFYAKCLPKHHAIIIFLNIFWI